MDRFSLLPRKVGIQHRKASNRKTGILWRFGRRLSLIALPLVQLEEGGTLVIWFHRGLVDVGIAYTLSKYYEAGEISECHTKEMRIGPIKKETVEATHLLNKYLK